MQEQFTTDESDRPLSRLVWTVDAGFCALLVACGLRYYTVHPFSGTGTLVCALALGSLLAYLVAVLGSPSLARRRTGVLAATALWIPLAVLAPSFGWVAFALFFSVHRALSGRAARIVSAAIVLAVCVGMFQLSGGQDPGLILGPLLGGIVLSVVYDRLTLTLENRRRLIAELVATRDQLARSEREAGALAERSRVASELHDTVVQHTASALLLLESVDAHAPQVEEAREVLRDTLQETRQLMHGLAHPRSEEESLTSALRDLSGEFSAAFAVVGDERPIPEDAAHALLRISQESLTNVRKHAGHGHATVTLTFFPADVGVDIVDTGVGFDPSLGQRGDSDAARPAGYGLRAMQWRAESLGGSLTIESEPGEGTVVAAVVPVPDTSEEAR